MTKVEAAKVLRAMEKALIETGSDSPLDCMIPLFKEACLMGAEALDPQPTEKPMKKFECLVKFHRITERIVRWFTDSEHAFNWLELEGYKVLQVKEIS